MSCGLPACLARFCGYNDDGSDDSDDRLGFKKEKKILFINAQVSLITVFFFFYFYYRDVSRLLRACERKLYDVTMYTTFL